MSAHTPGPWRYREWGGLIVGGGAGSDEVLICTMATNTRHDEGRHNRALILAAPTMQARIAELEAQCESAHAAQRHAETELAQYMAWYAMAEHQHLHEKARAERAEANAANWEEQANDRVIDWDEVRAERDALRADAERYRHLRDIAGNDIMRKLMEEVRPSHWDSIVDAAIARGKE